MSSSSTHYAALVVPRFHLEFRTRVPAAGLRFTAKTKVWGQLLLKTGLSGRGSRLDIRQHTDVDARTRLAI